MPSITYTKKGTTPLYSICPNEWYADLYDNNQTTYDIQSGTIEEGGVPVTRNTIFMADFILPEKPKYGSGELKSASIGIYVNEVLTTYGSGIPALQVYKLNQEIGNREGGKGSAGSLIDDEDIVVIPGYSTKDFSSITENFQGAGVWGMAQAIGQGGLIKDVNSMWLTPEHAYQHGDRFGANGTMLDLAKDFGLSDEDPGVREIIHGNLFCDTRSDGQRRCYIYDAGVEGWWLYSYNTVKMGYEWAEAFECHSGGSGISLGYDEFTNTGVIKYDWDQSAVLSSEDSWDNATAISLNNTIFDKKYEETSWAADHPDSPNSGGKMNWAYNRITRSAKNPKEENSINMLMESRFPHRHNMYQTHAYYPPKLDYSDEHSGSGSNQQRIHDSENQSVSFISTKLPLPVHLYTREPTANGDGRQPLTPEVRMTLDINTLAPMLQRGQQDFSFTRSGYSNTVTTQSAHEYRLNRSFVVTFSEEEPRDGENLYSFILRHAGSGGSPAYITTDGSATGSGKYWNTGSGVNPTADDSKSLMGLAFVENEGELSYYHLENLSSGANDGDVSFILDSARGEVCFKDAPTKLDYNGGTYTNLTFQFHPDDDGTYWAIYDDEGRIKDTDKLKNCKRHVDYYGGSQTVTTTNDRKAGSDSNYGGFPRHMTFWNNIYPPIKGEYSALHERYTTNLIVDRSYTNSATQSLGWTDAEGVWRNAAGAGGITNPAYALLGAGDKLTFMDKWDGTDRADRYVKVNNRAMSAYKPTLEFDSSVGYTTASNAELHWNSDPDKQQGGAAGSGALNEIYIDKIMVNHFNIQHTNSTVSEYGHNRSNIIIPKTVMTPSTGWAGDKTATHINSNETQQPCYISLGFSSLAKLQGTLATNSLKYLLFNNYTTEKSYATEGIITSNDSDVSNLRVGFTSDVEAYGRQGAASSLIGTGAVIHPDIGNGESPVFGNNEGSPNYTNRGLVVGDLDSSGREFSVETSDTRTTDLFTQKGTAQWRFGVRVTDSTDETSNLGNAVVAAGATTFRVGSGSNFTQYQYIKVEDEIMQITNISSNTLTVTRGIEGTDDVEHPDAVTIYHCAIPQKRENIFASARILKANGNQILVDESMIFENRKNEEYIIYKYNEDYRSTTDVRKDRTYKVVRENSNWITLDQPLEFENGGGDTATGSGDHPGNYLISPKRYWLILEIMNIGGAHAWQDFSSSHKLLPTRQYENLVALNELGTVGATYNESLYNDGQNINIWNLSQASTKESGLVSLKDYGFGAYDEETKVGGHAGYQQLSNQNVNTYITLNMDKVVEVDKLEPGDVLPLLFTTPGMDDGFKVNIDTENGTFPLYMIGTFEDELPTVSDFTVAPNEDDPYNIDFTWQCNDDDIWYGFIMLDDRYIHNQYQNAVIHLPMNEVGVDGGKADAPTENIQGLTTSVESTATTGPFYDIEGLAGYSLKCTSAGTSTTSPYISIGNGSQDVLNQTNYTTTTEMSFLLHFTHDADTDGTLSGLEYLLFKDDVMSLEIQTNGTLRYMQHWDANSYVELVSSSIIPLDGESPTSVMVTFDANLTNGNVKLFINGQLEDLSGEIITADATGSQNGWYYGQPIEANNNALFVSNGSDTSANKFLGRMEEFVLWNKCLYPIDPLLGSFTLIKHLEEVADNNDFSPPKSYTAKLFIKDYHNIRGSTVRDVCTSSGVSIKKSSFRMDTT